ncbi:MAG TPA: twin-arginine translocase TatA/TatE family subunit [Acidimicrobiales bacterium]|nr:twin-arginine translocase TatA/TatE family subunit [Acidimicrobiales bacterium]
MGILDPAKLAVVFVIAFLVLGPERLPGIARRLGSTVRQISEFREEAAREIRESVGGVDIASVARLAPTQLASRFIDDLVAGEGALAPSTVSPGPLESAVEDPRNPVSAPRHKVGLDRILELIEPTEIAQSSKKLDLSSSVVNRDNVLMN